MQEEGTFYKCEPKDKNEVVLTQHASVMGGEFYFVGDRFVIGEECDELDAFFEAEQLIEKGKNFDPQEAYI